MEVKKKRHYNVFGDDPLMDILYICYQDLCRGQLTPYYSLQKVMIDEYVGKYSKTDMQNFIHTIEEGKWLDFAGKNKIHLTESGAELYLSLSQTRRGIDLAEKANELSDLAKTFGLIAVTMSFFSLVFQLISFFSGK